VRRLLAILEQAPTPEAPDEELFEAHLERRKFQDA
jgi:hypothetical protein